MNTSKHPDDLFMDENPEFRTSLSNLDISNTEPLFPEDVGEAGCAIKLFPDELSLIDLATTDLAAGDLIAAGELATELNEPLIRLLPDNPSEEAVLRLRVQLLEVKLAKQNAQINFAERIDVDHLEWKRQKNRIVQLQAGNFLLMLLSIALMIGAGCLAVVR